MRFPIRPTRPNALVVLVLIPYLLCPGGARAAQPLRFNRDIRPILAEHCFACHGADAGSRKADLRLDQREVAIEMGAIEPKMPKESELVARIFSQDAEAVMPPPEAKTTLTKSQKDMLVRWIKEGAEYQKHWSFIPAQRPAVPKLTAHKSWPKNAIDHFVLERMRAAGLEPAPEANRFALIRRLYLDLIGLPPSQAAVDRFVGDQSDQAYERVVDELLASKHFGEHWARMWLDLARYADTKGYEKDLHRDIWRYRDWVVDAFNSDMPYTQFTVEQLAGDLLPKATTRGKLATAFHRNTMTNDEGGTDNEEFRTLAVKDRVDTTVQVWMGLTMGCAKCHSHKYDPISQKEYYQVFAIFNQTVDADRSDDAPRMSTPTMEQEQQLARLNAQLAEKRRRYLAETDEMRAARRKWEVEIAQQSNWSALRPASTESSGGAEFKTLEDDSLLVSGPNPPKDTYTIVAGTSLRRIAALRLEALTHSSLKNQGPGRNAQDPNFVVNELTLEVIDSESKIQTVKLVKPQADFSQRGWAVGGAIDGNPKTGWAISPHQRKPHVATFQLEEPIELDERSRLRVTLAQNYGNRLVLGRFRLLASSSTEHLEPSITMLPVLAARDPSRRTKPEQARLNEAFRQVYPATATLSKEVKKLERQIADLNKSFPNTPVMVELAEGKKRATHFHIRGNFLDQGEAVAAGLPKSFGTFDASDTHNRLSVAQWLLQDENPLTARVAVNRVWARIFGRGLVETEEDFGTQGTLPSHPELLDWLAIEYRDSLGWSHKKLCKTIVMSAAYRQSSTISKSKRDRDPQNRWLSRAPRFRLTAETVRDQALAASGLLTPAVGGPSVMPPQPDGIWKTTYSRLKWKTATGVDRYRRGLYTYWRRTSPYPSMLTFDAGSREVCIVRRIRTNIPLQALVTMNDPVFVEASGALAKKTLAADLDSDSRRVVFAFRKVLVRPPSTQETERLVDVYKTALAEYQEDEAAARQLLESSRLAAMDGVSNEQLAAWTIVANVLLNLDETLMRN